MDYLYMALTIFWGWLGLDCAIRDKVGSSVLCAILSGVFWYHFLSL